MKAKLLWNQEARLVRKVSGSTQLEETLCKAVGVLALHGIPHWVVGGIAVQEWGYPRFTADVDIVVPNVEEAREKLTSSGFVDHPKYVSSIVDRPSGVEVDLMPVAKVSTVP